MENASALIMQLCGRQVMMTWQDREGSGPQHPFSWPVISHYLMHVWNIMSIVAHRWPYTWQQERHQARCPQGSVSERVLLTKVGCLSTFRCQNRMDGACELQVSHESFGFLIKAEKREGKNMRLPRFKAVIQTNMFMPWAVSFQNSIKAALGVGNFNGRSSLM